MNRTFVPQPASSPASLAPQPAVKTVKAVRNGPSLPVQFRAEIDVSEIDERARPGPIWAGRACELSRSTLTFRSRRMCYAGRELLVLVHLVDDSPTPLAGTVLKSEYDGDALYRTQIALQQLPESEVIRAWISAHQQQHHRAA